MSRSRVRRRGRADPQRHGRQDPADGGARHERGVRPGRPDRGGGVRRSASRCDTPRQHPRQSRRCRKRISAAMRRRRQAAGISLRNARNQGPARVLRQEPRAARGGPARRQGEIVSLLGRNGVGPLDHGQGRSWDRSIVDRLDPFKGEEISGLKAFQIAHNGLGYVPENRDIFPTLTVEQNMLLGEKKAPATARWSVDDMYALFPRAEASARTRAAGVLSGGEQQMLTLVPHADGRPGPDHDRRADRRPGAEDRRPGGGTS